MKFRRREFLLGCGAATVGFAPEVRAHEAPATESAIDYHLHPRYREQTPLEPVLAKVDASLDIFPLEKDHDNLAATLKLWSKDLCKSPRRIESVMRVLAEDFRAVSLQAHRTKDLRSNNWLKVHQVAFSTELTLQRGNFGGELTAYLEDFTSFTTAEFQITAIESTRERHWKTSVQYELVGSGANFFREQRTGTWELEWEQTTAGECRIALWRAGDETRSRSTEVVYADISAAAFGRARSYSEQLVHGVDYWRTILDGACRIDVYGHNGVSIGDIDADGWDDLYVCQPAGLPNRLFRNRRNGEFEDITDGSGVGILENTACALFADFRSSGVQDLLVVRADGPVLFLNDGQGRFQEKRDAFQFAQAPQGTFTGAAAADYDGDGWLDIYFCLYVYYQGTNQYKYPMPYYDANNGPPNFLMRNQRDGTFRDATAQAGLNQNNTRYSFCCGWTDINGDGWPDLYVVNDFGRKNLYRNKGDGTFTDVAAEAGVEDLGAGMSICATDFDNDGQQDLYVADMWTTAGERISVQTTFQHDQPEGVRALYRKHAMGNSLFRNRGDGTFRDTTAKSGTGMGRWSWSSDSWDFDHDGLADLYVANGMISGPLREDLNSFFWRQVVAKSPAEAKPAGDYEQGWSALNQLIRADYSWSGYERNVFFANHGDGTFSDVSGAIGLDFIDDGRAFALADLDHDGRLEVLLKNRSGPQLRLLKNVVRELPLSISIRLRGTKSNRDAIGATVVVEAGGMRQTRMLQAGSGFLSQHSKELLFGLGAAAGEIRVTVLWPSGATQTLLGIQPHTRVLVEEGRDGFRAEGFETRTNLPSAVTDKSESLPDQFETWLLAPFPAPDFSLSSADGRTHTLAALRGRCVLLHLCADGPEGREDSLTTLQESQATWAARGLQIVAIDLSDEPKRSSRRFPFPVVLGTQDVAAIYNILYRTIFDRHRDLSFPTSFLLDPAGMIVKVYGGAVNPEHVATDFQDIPRNVEQRLSKALPFGAKTETFSFGRNNLSLASIYFQRGYFDEAGTWFSVALQDDPSSAEAHYGVGSVLLKQGKNAEAQTSFEQATKLDSSYPDTKPNAWNNLGLLAAQENRTNDAIAYFSEALRWNPEYVVALLNLGNAFRQAKAWNAARNVLERALHLKPDDAEVNYSLGMVFAQIDQPERAYEQLQKALQLRPSYPEAMNNLGVLYLRTKRRNEAVAEFEQCIRIAPAFDQPYLNLARVYAIEGNRDMARTTLMTLLQQNPDHPQALSLLKELTP